MPISIDYDETIGHSLLGSKYMLPSDFKPLSEIERFERAFSRTPFRFHFVIKASAPGSLTVAPEDGVITVGIGNNANSRDRISFTPWILAHRLGHCVQACMPSVDHEISGILGEIVATSIPDFPTTYRNWSGIDHHFHESLVGFLTTRCARKNAVVNSLDIFAELLAQHIICGGVKLTVPERVLYERSHFPKWFDTVPTEVKPFEQRIDAIFHRFLSDLQGKTIAW